MTEITDLSEVTFEEATGSETPVLVDFWAEWCAPCRAIAPVLKEIATEQAGRLRVAKLNVDDHPGIAQRLGVMAIPTLILFQKGEERARVRGAMGKPQLLKQIESHLI